MKTIEFKDKKHGKFVCLSDKNYKILKELRFDSFDKTFSRLIEIAGPILIEEKIKRMLHAEDSRVGPSDSQHVAEFTNQNAKEDVPIRD